MPDVLSAREGFTGGREFVASHTVKVMKRSPKAAQEIRKSSEDSAARFVPPGGSLADLKRAAATCKGCDLWKNATQTVFGEGTSRATIMLVGEQPGDQEDLKGRPFVGPAGRILDDALAEAGIDRTQVYVTNVVKHFKWAAAERGKKRIHKKPRYFEIHACRPWLDCEIQAVRPQVVVCMGATAAQALLGKTFSVTRQHGQLVESSLAPFATATIHPSAILRAPTSEMRHQQMRTFVNDLKQVAQLAMRRAA